MSSGKTHDRANAWMGGASRMAFYGITETFPDTAPEELSIQNGMLSVTVKQVRVGGR